MLSLRLAWRTLWRHSRRTIISLVSIAFGLALAIVFGSLANGIYQKSIDDATRTLAGPLTVEAEGFRDDPSPAHAIASVSAVAQAARGISAVSGVKPIVGGAAMVATASGSAPVSLIGVDPAIEAKDSPLVKHIVAGRFLRTDDARGAIVGATLAKRLDLQPGRKLVVTATDVHGEITTDLLRVTGVFATGADEFDGFFVEVPADAARRSFGLGADQATQVGILAVHRDDASLAAIAKDLRPRLAAGERLYSWRETMPALSGWISLDRHSQQILRALIVALVLFTILNTILMSVLERAREFAVLLALGTPPSRLRLQVFLETTLLAAIGCVCGAIVGGSVSLWGAIHGIDLTSLMENGHLTVAGFAVDPQIHFAISTGNVLLLTGLVFVATIAVGLWPTFRATRVEIATQLRSAR